MGLFYTYPINYHLNDRNLRWECEKEEVCSLVILRTFP